MEAADLLQGRPAQQRRGAAEESGIPLVEPFLHEAVEHLVLGGQAKGGDVLLDGIRVEEEMWGLDEEQPLVDAEEANGLGQEVPRRGVVGVEHRDDIAVAVGEAVVEIAGLGVSILLAGEIADPQFGAESLHVTASIGGPGGRGGVVRPDLLLGPSVVEQEHAQLARRVDHALGGGQGRRDDLDAFVVGRDENVDGRGCVGGELRGPGTVDRIRDREQAQEHHRHAV